MAVLGLRRAAGQHARSRVPSTNVGETVRASAAARAATSRSIRATPTSSTRATTAARSQRQDRYTGISESARVYADSETGQRALDMKYRFQWNAPIRLSPHNPDIVYTTSQYVHRSKDGGQTWERISPDLTRNDKKKQDFSGGEGITRDSTGVEVYSTVFAFEESPATAGLLWAGSDDGLVQLSRDNGKSWQNITPPGLPEYSTINVIDLIAEERGPRDRHRVPLHAERLDAVRVPHERLRQDVEADRRRQERHSGRSLPPRRPSGSGSAEPALRRHRIRHVHLVRRRRARGSRSS